MKFLFPLLICFLFSASVGATEPIESHLGGVYETQPTMPAVPRLASQFGVGIGTALVSTFAVVPGVLFLDETLFNVGLGVAGFGLTFGAPLAVWGMGDSFNANGKWWATTLGYFSGAGAVGLIWGAAHLYNGRDFGMGWATATVGVGVVTSIVAYELSRPRRDPSDNASPTVSLAPVTNGEHHGAQLRLVF